MLRSGPRVQPEPEYPAGNRNEIRIVVLVNVSGSGSYEILVYTGNTFNMYVLNTY